MVRETLVLKKVGIFSLYLLRVSFSVRLNRIIILVERLMSLNGNLFLKFKFQSCLNYRFIHFESSYSFLLRASRTESHQNQRPHNLIRLRFVSESNEGPTRVPARDCLTNRIRIWLWLAVRVRGGGFTNVLTHFVSGFSLFFC